MVHCAQVVIDGAADLEFSYLIPDALQAKIAIGSRVRIHLRNRQATGTVLRLEEMERRDPRWKEIQSLVHERPILTPALVELGTWMASYYSCSMEAALRGMLPESVRSDVPPVKTRKMVELIKRPDAEELATLRKRAPRQADVLEQLQLISQPLPLAKLPSSQPVKALVEKAWVRVRDERIERDPHEEDEFLPSTPLTLNPEQEVALKAITGVIDNPATDAKPILLHGVTGSGKTEVYLQAIDFALRQNKTILLLVPEISLTPQTVRRVKSRFADRQKAIAVLHSHLSEGERFDEWHKVHRREATIVIGARSALFAPLENLGLIIVDEEHENTYKQETTPRYHGRDLAVLRGRMEHAAVVLGSATPSLESYFNALKGKYRHIELTKRADNQSLPLIRVINMKMERKGSQKEPSILSEKLRTSMEERLKEGEQVILFLNRRGFATSMQCLDCGHVCECQHCSVSLTYHLSKQRLVCHICGYKQIAPRRCPKCRNPAIRFGGYGTEKVEEVLKKVFPQARLARVDADSMQRKNVLKNTLKAFQTKKIDILLGTQMIAKGLHFPNVTLVGILNADLGLHIPDFRAGERVFSLLVQVSGRAGRGDLEGEVLVQTYTPESPSIQFARHHDYSGYAMQELDFRRQCEFPPYTHVEI
ncbi:MAG: primosomal protein N' [Verrucomicrobiota bacterium]